MINTKAEVESNEDGGYTLKMSMGTKDNLFIGSEKTWDKYKKILKTHLIILISRIP